MAKRASRKTTKAGAKPIFKRAAVKSVPLATSPTPRVGGVRLLAGGNPQIAKGDGDAPVQAYIAAMPEWKRDIGRRLDALITRAVPNVRKAVKWNSPFYGVDDPTGEGVNWFLAVHCYTKYVKIVFFSGASLHPIPPGESKKPEVRYLDIRQGDWGQALGERQLTDWVRQASKLPGWDGRP